MIIAHHAREGIECGGLVWLGVVVWCGWVWMLGVVVALKENIYRYQVPLVVIIIEFKSLGFLQCVIVE